VTVKLYGHRGAAAELPENTMASFERALAVGVDVLEMDVHMTADGGIVVSHDPSGARMAGANWPIAEASLAEVQRWDAGWGFIDAAGCRPFAGCGFSVPTLNEVLSAFPNVELNIDIKPYRPSMVEPLLSLLTSSGAEERVTLASFHGPVIREVRARRFRGATVLAADEVRALLVAPARLWRALGSYLGPAHAVQVPPRIGRLDLASPRFIARCHALGLRVDYWVVNEPRQAEMLLARGADGIITDDPARILPVIERARS
jgi:glycerophosphoryl diester phosphodiesterase